MKQSLALIEARETCVQCPVLNKPADRKALAAKVDLLYAKHPDLFALLAVDTEALYELAIKREEAKRPACAASSLPKLHVVHTQ